MGTKFEIAIITRGIFPNIKNVKKGLLKESILVECFVTA